MYYKAIVMEININYVIVMKNDGTLTYIKYKPGLKIGDNIIFTESDIYKKKKNTL